MPLLRIPTTEELEDHFFGSDAFQFGWFLLIGPNSFPTVVGEISPDNDNQFEVTKTIHESDFVDGIKRYSEVLVDRTFDDLIEDMDAVDVDNVIQLIMFGEIRYA